MKRGNVLICLFLTFVAIEKPTTTPPPVSHSTPGDSQYTEPPPSSNPFPLLAFWSILSIRGSIVLVLLVLLVLLVRRCIQMKPKGEKLLCFTLNILSLNVRMFLYYCHKLQTEKNERNSFLLIIFC